MTQRSRKGFSVAKRIATVVVSMLCFAFGLTACGGSGGNGTYYLYQNGSLDRSQYVTINGGNWTDDDGETGEVKISGETITLYVEFFGEKEEFASGTVKNGVLTLRIMGAEIVYAILIEQNVSQGERLKQLNNMAKSQLRVLEQSNSKFLTDNK